jgi:hypothetical protein
MEGSPPPASPPAPERRVSVGGVINEAFELYGAHFAPLVLAAAAIFVVSGVIQGLLNETDSFVLSLVGSIVSLVAWALFTGFVVSLVADVRDGRRDFTAGELLSSGWHVVLPLIGFGILFGIGVAIGFLLLIIPGLYLLTIWAVGVPAIVVERAGVIEAFGRSHELVRGHGWTVFGAIIVAFLILWGLGFAAVLIGAAIGDAAGAIILAIIVQILAAPFAALVSSVLFFALGGGAGTRATETPPPAPAPAV